MARMKIIRRFFLLLLFGAVLAGGAYVQSEGFSHKWRSFVVGQFEQRGIFLTLDKITLDPLEGIVARNIQIFQDKERHTLLAVVDRLNLDLDYTKLIHDEPSLQGVDLRNASVSFPIDPDDANAEKINLSGLSARLFIVGDRIEIRKAEGKFSGLQISITGSLLRAPPSEDPDEEKKAAERLKKRMDAIKTNKALIVQTLKLLEHFETAHAPHLDIEVNGDLARPEEMTANLRLSADGLRQGTYECKNLELLASYAGETIDLKRLYVKDHLGELEASATYHVGADSADFHLHSGVDLPALASSIFEKGELFEMLHEIVFYEPVEIVADGHYLLEKAAGPDPVMPVRCSGSLHLGRFTSRGEVFKGLAANFGLSPQGCYFRDVVLSHKSGTLGLQAMWKRDEGFRYRALLRMDTSVFLPFVQLPQTQEVLRRFKFREDSGIFAKFEGVGDSPDIGLCLNHGHVELHDFKYQGAEMARFEADIEFQNPAHTYRNVRVERAEGRATAEEVACNDDEKTVRFKRVVSDCDPVALMSCFNLQTADVISKYRFDKHPHVEVDGLFSEHDPATDFRVKFRAGGTAHYILWDDDYTVSKPVGDLHFKGTQLLFDVSGSVFGQDMTCKGTTDLRERADTYTVTFKSGVFPYFVFGKKLSFNNVRANIACKSGNVDFDVKSSVLDGTMSLKGTLDDRKKPEPYAGELRFDAVSFKKFARVYSPDYETEGDFSGHFEFTGRLSDWKALKGKGALVILNGNLYNVPILGPLTPLLGALLPRPISGYNVAKEADATFSIADGFLDTKDFVALTSVFRLETNGRVDFIEDRIKFYAQAKFRGLPGLVLFPVSQILEYVGEGTVGDPQWRSRFFSLGSDKGNMRKPK